MKSMYILKFAQGTEWPEAYKQGDFVIGVVNDAELAKNLEASTATKKMNSQTVVVKQYASAADVGKCHVLVATGGVAEVEAAVNKAKAYNTLTVTQGAGLVDRLSAINLIVAGNQPLKFEMNRKMFRDHGLVVSIGLENLATRVIN